MRLLCLGLLACCVPVSQLYIYHSDAPWAGEKLSHSIEFSFDGAAAHRPPARRRRALRQSTRL